MKLLNQKETDSLIVLTVEADPDKFKEIYLDHFNAVAKNVSVPGFRKGHAPVNVVIQYLKNKDHMGCECEKVADKVINLIVKDIEKEHKELNKKIFGYPVGKKLNEFNVDKWLLVCDVDFEKYPSVKLGDYSSIYTLIEKKETPSGDFCPISVNREVRQGDLVSIAMVAKDDNSKVSYRFTYDLLEFEVSNTKIRQEIVDSVFGCKKGDKKSFTMQSDGVNLNVDIWVMDIRELKKIDEDLVRKLGFGSSVDEFKKYMVKQYEVHNSLVRYQDIMKWLSSNEHAIHPVPFNNLKMEVGLAYEKMKKKYSKTTMSAESIFYEHLGHLKTTLVLNEISKQENVQIDDKDKEEFLKDINDNPWLYGNKKPEEIFNSPENMLKEYITQFKTMKILFERWKFSN